MNAWYVDYVRVEKWYTMRCVVRVESLTIRNSAYLRSIIRNPKTDN